MVPSKTVVVTCDSSPFPVAGKLVVSLPQGERTSASALADTKRLAETLAGSNDPKMKNSKFLQFVSKMSRGEIILEGNQVCSCPPSWEVLGTWAHVCRCMCHAWPLLLLSRAQTHPSASDHDLARSLRSMLLASHARSSSASNIAK